MCRKMNPPPESSSKKEQLICVEASSVVIFYMSLLYFSLLTVAGIEKFIGENGYWDESDRNS